VTSLQALGTCVRALVVITPLAICGCGNEVRNEPITDLTEEHKKQIEELNKQRAQEWGNRK
jgi:hypothetical protein